MDEESPRMYGIGSRVSIPRNRDGIGRCDSRADGVECVSEAEGHHGAAERSGVRPRSQGEVRVDPRLRFQDSGGAFLMSFSMASTTFSVTSFWK